MPKPKIGQTEKEFIAMCIPTVLDEGTAKTPSQAVAICYSIWKEHKKNKPKIKRSK